MMGKNASKVDTTYDDSLDNNNYDLVFEQVLIKYM